MTVEIPRDGRVLFIGDSITDAGRDRSDPADLGVGWAMMAAAWFTARHPEQRVTFRNRGVGGDRVRDLRARWADDCLALSPQVVSVLIGINDTWRRYSSGEATTVEEFTADYRHLLAATREALPDVRLVLMEPFLLPVDDDQRRWRDDLDPKVDAVRKLAAEFDATLLAVQARFDTADVDDRVWTDDGVHLTPPGHAVLAQQWLAAVTPGT
ncbi:SGNH/GDSL hydrolase family protein [Micromonospora sp. HUAS LYJ1]|uniref:SGNH/GDSL hydrolase family protein n=1 Tax=Micromonospora sp. HUAS LYJ1 TaxID=3061626 RepID=UPI002671CD2A|nr:SGNH/GDSL hydrolase family protein [Micromonospora sp. HUAS LYJ1]WKU06184.1 SGNH/GDSL hydrolase family protein [Micromonospora sp. HUAS LYJ1]